MPENILVILYTLLLLVSFVLFMFIFKYISTGKEGVKKLFDRFRHPFELDE